MEKLKIIIGSTRETRAADLVSPWVISSAKAKDTFEVEVLDLRDWPLPMFAEHIGTIGDFRDPTYSDPIVKRWKEKIKEGDAFLVVTTEYNHSIPGVLKNAIDSVFFSFAFRNKPLSTVSYSNGIAGGSRAIEHLAHIAIEAELVPLRNTVIIPKVNEAFGPDAKPLNPMSDIAMTIMLDDLVWWSKLLREARAKGQLLPGGIRTRQALAALTTNS